MLLFYFNYFLLNQNKKLFKNLKSSFYTEGMSYDIIAAKYNSVFYYFKLFKNNTIYK